jgi:hypothetical protein
LPVLRQGNHLLRREENSFSIAIVSLLVGPIVWELSHYSPTVFESESAIANANVAVIHHDFADALNRAQEIGEPLHLNFFEKFEIWKEEVIWENQIVNAPWVRCFQSLTDGDVEVHAFVPDTFDRAVDRVI